MGTALVLCRSDVSSLAHRQSLTTVFPAVFNLTPRTKKEMTMDYTYIEQLLDKYFSCETSLGEEKVLRAFFAQEDVPIRLLPYRQLFAEMTQSQAEEALGTAFDQKVLALISEQESRQPLRVKARMVTMQRRLRPLYKAAACVAVVLALGQAAQMPYSEKAAEQENIADIIKTPDIKKGENAVAKSDTATKAAEVTVLPVAN